MISFIGWFFMSMIEAFAQSRAQELDEIAIKKLGYHSKKSA